jgi:hypothetical protein
LWVDPSGRLAEVVFSVQEIEQLKAGKAVGSYAPDHPVARWTYGEASAAIRRRLGEIEARQQELRGDFGDAS